jgi:epoxyqueuosine reductase
MMIDNATIERIALRLGFSLVGFSSAEQLTEEISRLKTWLADGFQSGMAYMERNLEKREDVRKILPEAKSVITLGMNYYTSHRYSGAKEMGKISRYAWGKDYHLIMWEKLEELITELRELEPDLTAISYVDTGPVMDKAWAIRSGIGWMGKNANIINREMGSWFFIGNILTNKEFAYGTTIGDFCGSCRACLDACPTDAFAAPYVVDANKCISYLTIENKGEIPEQYVGKFDGWLFGCDVCQDVCPWNKKYSVVTGIREFEPIGGKPEFAPADVLSMGKAEFDGQFAESPIKRAKLSGLQRNAAFLLTENHETGSDGRT